MIGNKKFNRLGYENGAAVAEFLTMDLGAPRLVLTERDLRAEITQNGCSPTTPRDDTEERSALRAILRAHDLKIDSMARARKPEGALIERSL